jgi:hypothetical protein
VPFTTGTSVPGPMPAESTWSGIWEGSCG